MATANGNAARSESASAADAKRSRPERLGANRAPRLASELALLKEITQTVASSLDLGEVLKRIVKLVGEVTAADGCLIYLLDEAKGELVLMETKSAKRDFLGQIKLRLGEGITGWVASESRAVVLEENAHRDPRFRFFQDIPEDKYQAFLSMPIVNKGKVVGVVNVHHRRKHRYPPRLVELLTTVASQVGVAIVNARAHEQAVQRARQVQALARVSSGIVSDMYIDEVLQLIATMTAEVIGSKICSIMLLDEKKGELILAATHGLGEEYRRRPNIKITQSISGKVLKQGKPLVVADVRRDREFAFPDLAAREGLVSMASVPMLIRDRAVGVINAYTPVSHEFTDEEMRILQGMASQAAVAIENTKLLNKVEKMEENIETRKVVERAKGILMKENGLSEEEAYRLIHKKSMDIRKPMKEVAEAILLAADVRK